MKIQTKFNIIISIVVFVMQAVLLYSFWAFANQEAQRFLDLKGGVVETTRQITELQKDMKTVQQAVLDLQTAAKQPQL